jgi:iron(III) transport system permease protein
MSVAIYDRIYSAEFGSAAAYGSLQIVLIFAVLVISNRLQGTRRRRRRSGAAEQTKITTTPLS